MNLASTQPISGTIRVWDLPLRLFHWLLVIVIAVAFLSSEEDSALNQWHVMSGWVAGLLILFRFLWGFVGGEHARFASFIRPSRIGSHIGALLRRRPEASLGHNALGGLSVVLLLLLVGGTVVTGAIRAGEVHELIAWTLLALVAVHVAAVFAMSLLSGENLVSAMIGGGKPARIHPGGKDADAAPMLAIPLVILVLAGAVWGILSYDPQAFSLRSAEDYEHAAHAGAPGGASTHAEDRRRDQDD